jgi:bacterioferritin
MDKTKSIGLLNTAVVDELHAVHQYMYFHFHLDNQGLGPLSGLFKRVAIQEMGHVERLAERILFLQGDVNMRATGDVRQIVEPEQMLAWAKETEEARASAYNDAVLQCGSNADSATKHVFEQLVQDEERHFDEFGKQLDDIRRFGPCYLALQPFNTAPEGCSLGST